MVRTLRTHTKPIFSGEMDEYKNIITGLLSSLARADIRFDDFNRILEQMREYNFITKAYKDFYIDYRKKYREKMAK